MSEKTKDNVFQYGVFILYVAIITATVGLIRYL